MLRITLFACVLTTSDAIALGLPGRVRTISISKPSASALSTIDALAIGRMSISKPGLTKPSVRLIDLLPACLLVPSSPFALSIAFGCGFSTSTPGRQATTSNRVSRTRRPMMLADDELPSDSEGERKYKPSSRKADVYMRLAELAVANAFARACANGSLMEGCQMPWVGLESSLADDGLADCAALEEEAEQWDYPAHCDVGRVNYPAHCFVNYPSADVPAVTSGTEKARKEGQLLACFLKRGAFSVDAALGAVKFRQLYRSTQP